MPFIKHLIEAADSTGEAYTINVKTTDGRVHAGTVVEHGDGWLRMGPPDTDPGTDGLDDTVLVVDVFFNTANIIFAWVSI